MKAFPLFLIFLCCANALVKEDDFQIPSTWIKVHRATSTSEIKLTIAVKQRNLDVLDVNRVDSIVLPYRNIFGKCPIQRTKTIAAT
jgi:hypothetical protein